MERKKKKKRQRARLESTDQMIRAEKSERREGENDFYCLQLQAPAAAAGCGGSISGDGDGGGGIMTCVFALWTTFISVRVPTSMRRECVCVWL